MAFIHKKPCAFALLLAVCLLSGCSLLLGPGEGPARLQLNPALPGAVIGSKASKAEQLIVAKPQASRDIDTDGIACIFNGREVRNLKGYRWAAPVPSLLQRSLVDGLEAAGAFASVADDASGLSASLRLQTDVRQFGLAYPAENATPTAVFEATFRMVDFATGRTIATLPVRVDVPASGKKPGDLAAACDKAVSQMLAKVVPWAVTNVKAGKK